MATLTTDTQVYPILTQDHYMRAEEGDKKAIRFIALIYLVGGPGITKDLTLAAYYLKQLAKIDQNEVEDILVRRADYLCDEYRRSNYALPTYVKLKAEINAVSQMLLCLSNFYSSIYERHGMTTRSHTTILKTALADFHQLSQ